MIHIAKVHSIVDDTLELPAPDRCAVQDPSALKCKHFNPSGRHMAPLSWCTLFKQQPRVVREGTSSYVRRLRECRVAEGLVWRCAYCQTEFPGKEEPCPVCNQ